MAKKVHSISSRDASLNFKSKVGECLSLLSCLDTDDKLDIWKFWKTISSAVKIAVNGKGDIVDTPRYNSKVRKEERKKQKKIEEEQRRMQKLERTAIAIYVPVRSDDKGFRKFRVLKLVNQKKIADYFEKVPCDEGEETEVTSVEGAGDFEYCDFPDIAKNIKQEEIVERISQLDKGDLGQEQVHSVSQLLRSPMETAQQQESEMETEPANIKSPSCQDQGYDPVQTPSSSCSTLLTTLQTSTPSRTGSRDSSFKIWPVTRPVTRSSTTKHKVVDNPPPGHSQDEVVQEESPVYDSASACKESVYKFNGNSINENREDGTITIYPNVKKDTGIQEEDFNITIVPVGDHVMHIIDEKPMGESSNQPVGERLDNEDVSYKEICMVPHSEGTDESAISQTFVPEQHYEIQIHQPAQSSEETEFPISSSGTTVPTSEQMLTSVQEDLKDSSQQGTSTAEQDSSQLQVSASLAQRNASDIETIISALEEELKKSGSTDGSISMATAKDGNIESSQIKQENSTTDQPTFVNVDGSTVELLKGQEIVEIAHVDRLENVIWTSDGEFQVIKQGAVPSVAAITTVDGVMYEQENTSQPLDVQYDVVEYEILADKRRKRGRKKKIKDSTTVQEEVLDRTCPMCHRVLRYASSMRAHMRIHTGDKPYSCGQCDRKFTTKANRDRHEATHVGLKPFQCSTCNKCFTEKRSLNVHQRTHTGERPFICNVCGSGFTQKCTLMVHMDRHTNKKGHLCDLCGKAFRQKSQLDVHVKRHKRQANFPCTECSTKCYTRGDLMRHMIRHTGERPFQCKLCPRGFTRKQYLMDHENTHYGRKPYKCSVCLMAFYDMGSCHRHLRKHREQEEAEEILSKPPSTMLSSEDFNLILDGSYAGQTLTLEDGTKATVKAVLSEADGSTVYHITRLSRDTDNEKEDNASAESDVTAEPQAQAEKTEGSEPDVLSEDADAKAEMIDQSSGTSVRK